MQNDILSLRFAVDKTKNVELITIKNDLFYEKESTYLICIGSLHSRRLCTDGTEKHVVFIK